MATGRGTAMNDLGNQRSPLVRYLDETEALDCPYGNVRRVVTGGVGGVANVHVVRVTRGKPHFHRGYDEVYFVLAGRGRMRLGESELELRVGAVAVVPAGTVHSLEAGGDDPLEFVIFGVPPLELADERARPRKARG
jgi:mannose-6-phosphate isomerase-like protein (cupin superfamily)